MFPTTHDLSPNTRDACLTVLDHILRPRQQRPNYNQAPPGVYPGRLRPVRGPQSCGHQSTGHAPPPRSAQPGPPRLLLQSPILILRRRACRCRRWWCHNRSRSRCRWGNAGEPDWQPQEPPQAKQPHGAERREVAQQLVQHGAGAATLAAASPSRVSTDQQNEQQNGQ